MGLCERCDGDGWIETFDDDGWVIGAQPCPKCGYDVGLAGGDDHGEKG